MFSNYFKTALRNLKKNKGFFALNFIGLYISVVVCILIALIILHETSFDKRAKNGPNIYRVVDNNTSSTGKTFSAVTPYPLASAMRAAMPGEQSISQIHYDKDNEVSFGDKKFKETNTIFADSVFPKLFPLTVKAGSIKRALAEPGFAILTEKTAERFFGKEDPIGKRIKFANLVDLEVAAIVVDAPGNTHLPYNMLLSYLSFRPEFIGGIPINEWSVHSAGFTYIGLQGDNKVKYTETILASIVAKNIHQENIGVKTEFKLQPLPDIHFNQLYAHNNPAYTVNYSYLYLIGAIGLFLMLAACINYTNLSTALAIKKSKEVGVRKTMGATRGHLIRQFLSETFLLSGFVMIVAIVSIRFLIPLLNDFLDKNIPVEWLNVQSIIFLLALWITVSFLSGLYPAFVLSGFNVITALKSKMSTPKRSVVILRKGLVTFQFLTAQILIIGAIVVAKQMDFVRSEPLGFEKDKVVDIALPENKPAELQALRNQLSAIPGISSFSLSLDAPVGDNQVNTEFNLKEKYTTEQLHVAVKAADKDYLKTYGLQLIAGRWFDETDENKIAESIPDSLRKYAFVLNETAVKSLGFRSPQDAIGKYVTFGLNDISAPVIGVVKDYHIASMHQPVSSVLMVEFPFFNYNVGIKFSGTNNTSTLAAVEKAWTSVYPQQIFEANFLDEHVASMYKDEKRTQQLFNLFTFISIIINVLGLVGLLSFIIEQKTKEIGIRKVLGASIKNISLILSKDFLRLIILAFLIAAPLGALLMNKWLEDFAYRTHISWWVYAVAILAALIVTSIAVGFQTIKAAVANPIKSLRTE
ncbi:MAG TPA: ABC transporter permease [Puia sp.]|jgi:putative ABC transport system permease protein|nr:ABC transporter permease [Puia sp.]